MCSPTIARDENTSSRFDAITYLPIAEKFAQRKIFYAQISLAKIE